MSDSGKSKMSLMVKPVIDESKTVGGNILGFAAGHLGFNNLVPTSFRTGWQGALTSVVILLAGLFAASRFEHPLLKSTFHGLSAYSFIKGVNQGTKMLPAVNGLGAFQIPQGAIDVLNKVFPNLGDAEPIAWTAQKFPIYNHNASFGEVVDQTYEVVDDGHARMNGYEYTAQTVNDFAFGIKAA